jgi:predicted membrane protein
MELYLSFPLYAFIVLTGKILPLHCKVNLLLSFDDRWQKQLIVIFLISETVASVIVSVIFFFNYALPIWESEKMNIMEKSE